ncbi:PREDICTED: girdin isoform X1 [Dufourea novaeangliae]|uniref:girdin isoform X1 n=1 Tax=Dufourea novaeangliae TaxID=178035 RepID=UPI000766EF91|nr:PREDICTED: girdin isoform X1 [Dufourea novaeangliae]XP_015438064.1 PREDICTED: girdin isoform X1 [Dufourea novaeangliae]
MASTDVDDLLSGPLVTWFTSCLEDSNLLTSYDDLVDGMLLHNVFLQIDPEPLHDEIIAPEGSSLIRAKNLKIIVDNMKQFYEEELGHLVLRIPDTTNLGKESELYVSEMKLLLLLLLGCAVQCPNKEKFITKIKTLNVDTQLAIVECIKQVTDYQDIVITQDAMENVNMGNLFVQIKKLTQELDVYRQKWRDTAVNESIERNNASNSAEPEEMSKVQLSNPVNKSEREDNHHYAVELADWKSKVRKQRQELEEKTEALLECKEELEYHKILVTKLKQENQDLMHEARTAKSYRDELDAVIERADRADRLEQEVVRYREKLTDIEFYKTRIEELREDNRVLMETREMLEDQLNSSRRRADKVLELESEIIKYKQLLNDMALERAADKEKYQELVDENIQLHKLTKAAANEAALADSISDSDEPAHADNRLSEQLTNNAQTRALKLELENRRLLTLIDSLKENSFHENSSRVLDLEKEKKKQSLKVESLNDNIERLTQQNSDLELVWKQALEENKKLQNSLKSQRTSSEKQQQEYQAQHTKMIELEKNSDTAVKEKQRVQSLLESVQRRADDLERSAELANQKLEELKIMESNVNELSTKCLDLESKLTTVEKEKDVAQRDIHRYRETIEEKDVALDKAANCIEVLERKVTQLEQELFDSVAQISRLQEIERSSKELDSRAAIDRETLEILQSSLVAEKLNTQQLYTILEKLGLSDNMLFSLPLDNILQKIAQIPEVVDYAKQITNSCSCEKLVSESATIENNETIDIHSTLEATVESLKKEQEHLHIKLVSTQTALENLLSENAKLQVHITTLQSQNNSLAAQHTALQLANSQLAAEKEELLKERTAQQQTHTQLLHDQDTLQSLHEQLNNEYENLFYEHDALKSNLRDVKNEIRILRESYEGLEGKNKALQSEKESLINNAKSLNNLRGEHSKLKDDFRNLYTATEKLKMEYRNLQEDYRKNKVETNRVSLKLTEMQGELSSRDERCSNLELQFNKLNKCCEMLLHMNAGLDKDKRSLMDHISLLFSQYHELLTRSLEDKEQYHMEEKMYTDKVNHLYRQKEKLEDKIMEHYRKLDSCTPKKKGFGANLVRRVRKAGSELLNKNRRSWAEDSKHSEGKTYESESGGNDSDASTEDHLAGSASRSLGSDVLSLGHPGTRRTVYYTDDSPPPSTALPEQGDDTPSILTDEPPRPEVQAEPRPVLIYNKVSAVINESKNMNSSEMKEVGQEEAIMETPMDKDPKAGSPVWYEYGCV